MGNYAFFRGCESRDALARRAGNEATASSDGGPEIEAKYSIPLFWLAGFSPDDLVSRRMFAPSPDDAPGEAPLLYLLPCASVRDYAARARARRAGILALVPAALGDYYDEWIRFVERRYARCVCIETSDIFSMSDVEEAGLRLRGGLRALQAADRGEAVRDTAALQWFAAFDDPPRERPAGETPEDAAQGWRLRLAGSAYLPGSGTLLWPTRPTPTEIAFAASLPEAGPPQPGTRESEDADLAALVRDGVTSGHPRGRLAIALQQLRGEVPLGVTAPTRGLRKTIGGGGELLVALRNGFFGMVFALLGPVFIWACWRTPVYWPGVGLGVLLFATGAWLLRGAWRAQRRFRAILRA